MTVLEALQVVKELLTIAKGEDIDRPEDYEALEVLVSLLDERDELRKAIKPFGLLVYWGKTKPDWLDN